MTDPLKRQFLGAVILLVIGGCNSNKSSYVADVNGKKISADDFSARYDKYRAQTSERDNIVLRKRILNNMVNEILIYDDLRRQGFDRDSIYNEKYQDIKDQALLDGYAKRITVDTMTVSNAELSREFRAYNTKASARFVYAKTEAEAWKLKEKLQHGTTFSGLAKHIFADPTLAKTGGYLGFFGYGDTEPAMQEAAFSLPVGVLSDPVRLRMGYAIIKVEKRFEMPLASDLDYAKAKPKLEDAIRQRKIMQFLKEEGDRITGELNPVFNDEALKKVLDSWNYIVGEDGSSPHKEQRYKEIENISSLPFAQFMGFSWTVKDFVEAVEKSRSKDRRRVKSLNRLKDMAVGLAMRTVLLQNARNAGLEQDERVRLQEKLARENYLLHRWASLAQDTVVAAGIDQDASRNYFEKNKDQFTDPPLVDVAEILVRTEGEASELMKEINQGADFGMLARTHSIRTSAAQYNGELGWVPQSAFGTVGEKVFRSRVGDIVGPEFLNPNFVILKILGKRPPRQRTFEESENEVLQALIPLRKQEAFASALETLRLHAKIDLNIDALGNIVVASN